MQKKNNKGICFFYILQTPFNTIQACIQKQNKQKLDFPRFISVIAKTNWRKLFILCSISLFFSRGEKDQYISLCKLKCAEGETRPSHPALEKAALTACSLVSEMCVPEDISNIQLLWDCCSLCSLLLTTNKIQGLSGNVDTFKESFQLKASTYKSSHTLNLQFDITASLYFPLYRC